MTATDTRIIIATVFVLAGLFIAVPVHDWHVLAGVLRAAAGIGTLVLVVRRHLARRQP